MEKRPEKYTDFDKFLHQTIKTRVGTILWSEAASLADNIKPNKKYYYTFRVVDVHGNVSNPSAVFEVEIIDDNGTVYFRQRIIELKPTEEKTPFIPMKKYIQIKPTLAQRVLDDAGMDFPRAESAFEYSRLEGTKGPLKLGLQKESVWGKKLKIRVTSKSTGKQIDLNVTFKAEQEDGLQLLGNTLKESGVVAGVQASAGGPIIPGDLQKSGEPISELDNNA